MASSAHSNFLYSHSANWSADVHFCGSGYALLFDDCESILNLILCQSDLCVSLIRLQPDGTYVITKYYGRSPTQNANLKKIKLQASSLELD